MPVTEFDNLLRDRYEQGNFEYKPASWERLSMELPVKKKKPFLRRILWLPLAAAAAVAAGFIVMPLLQDEHAARTAAPVASARRIAAPAGTPQVPAPVMNNTRPAAAPTASYAASAAHNATKSVLPIASAVPSHSSGAAVAQPPVTAAAYGPASAPPAARPEAAPVEGPAATPKATIALADNISATRKVSAPADYLAERPQYAEDARPRRFNPSSLSIAGGYKYGTANTGYMIGVNGRKSLGGKVFIESDLAFSNNRNAQLTTQTSAESFDQVKALATTNTVAARAVSRGEVISNMYYLQVTPTVGYQVFRHMSVGAGADVQRMFQDKDETAYVMDGTDVKALPQMDYGVVGKLEYSVTRNFKAGVQYRQGMNTMVAPEKNYLDRSYIQVQLKLGILGK